MVGGEAGRTETGLGKLRQKPGLQRGYVGQDIVQIARDNLSFGVHLN